MGRSVSFLGNAAAVVYIDFDGLYREDDCYECEGNGNADALNKYIGPSPACDRCEGTGENPYPETDEHDWECFMDNLADRIVERYPSMQDADEWPERETRTFLANNFAVVAVSEYCGLVSVSLRAADLRTGYAEDESRQALADAWTKQITAGFVAHLTHVYGEHALVKIGSFSNGEGVYKRATATAAA